MDKYVKLLEEYSSEENIEEVSESVAQEDEATRKAAIEKFYSKKKKKQKKVSHLPKEFKVGLEKYLIDFRTPEELKKKADHVAKLMKKNGWKIGKAEGVVHPDLPGRWVGDSTVFIEERLETEEEFRLRLSYYAEEAGKEAVQKAKEKRKEDRMLKKWSKQSSKKK